MIQLKNRPQKSQKFPRLKPSTTWAQRLSATTGSIGDATAASSTGNAKRSHLHKKKTKHEYQKAFHNKSWLIDKHIHLQLSWLSLYHFFSKKRFFSFKFSMIKAKLINFFPQAKQLNDIDFLLLTVVVFFFK